MSHMGKSHLVIMWTVGPDDVAEGDRIFASHGEWMKGHPREGDVALLDYTISKGPELSNPMDPSSEPTGKTIYVLDEYYESPAGIALSLIHISEPTRLRRISYAVFCLKKKK